MSSVSGIGPEFEMNLALQSVLDHLHRNDVAGELQHLLHFGGKQLTVDQMVSLLTTAGKFGNMDAVSELVTYLHRYPTLEKSLKDNILHAPFGRDNVLRNVTMLMDKRLVERGMYAHFLDHVVKLPTFKAAISPALHTATGQADLTATTALLDRGAAVNTRNPEDAKSTELHCLGRHLIEGSRLQAMEAHDSFDNEEHLHDIKAIILLLFSHGAEPAVNNLYSENFLGMLKRAQSLSSQASQNDTYANEQLARVAAERAELLDDLLEIAKLHGTMIFFKKRGIDKEFATQFAGARKTVKKLYRGVNDVTRQICISVEPGTNKAEEQERFNDAMQSYVQSYQAMQSSLPHETFEQMRKLYSQYLLHLAKYAVQTQKFDKLKAIYTTATAHQMIVEGDQAKFKRAVRQGEISQNLASQQGSLH